MPLVALTALTALVIISDMEVEVKSFDIRNFEIPGGAAFIAIEVLICVALVVYIGTALRARTERGRTKYEPLVNDTEDVTL